MKRQALSWRRSSYSKLHHTGMSEKCPNAKGSLKTQFRWVQGNTLWGEHSSEQAHAACCKSSEDQESANRLSSGMAMVFRSD